MPPRSRPLTISPSSSLAGVALLAGIALLFGAFAVSSAVNGAPLWLIAVVGTPPACFSYFAVVQWRRRNDFIVELHEENFRFRTYEREFQKARYCDVMGVEEHCSIKHVDGLSLQMANGVVSKIFVGLSPKDVRRVFQELRERSPHLRQPHSTIQRLRPVR